MKIPILPDPKSLTKYFPTQSRSATTLAPVPYPSENPRDILALPLLIDAFVQGASVDDEEDPDKKLRKANLHFLSSVFANLTVVSKAAKCFRVKFSDIHLSSRRHQGGCFSSLLVPSIH